MRNATTMRSRSIFSGSKSCRIFTIAAVCLVLLPFCADADPYKTTLKLNEVEPEPAGILAWFGQLNNARQKGSEVAGAIAGLGAPDFRTRRASAELLEEIGFLYQEALSAATEADDPEIVKRAQHLLDSAKKVDNQSMLYAAYTVLSEAPHPDYTTPIFQTLPFADTSFVLEAAFALLSNVLSPKTMLRCGKL